MSSHDVVPELDWFQFSSEHWDRRPVLIRRCAQPPFTWPDVLDALRNVRAAPPSATAYAQFTVDRFQQIDALTVLPRSRDRRPDSWLARLREQTEGHRYALIVNRLHGFGFPLWSRERAFFAGLWQQVGLPFSSAITTLFHGNYEHSPVGVHQDRFATFMFVLAGRKRMRFWSRRPWRHPVSTIVDYRDCMEDSFAVEVAEGELLYWPADYYHVGENVDLEPATSVNVGVPRCDHRLNYDVEELLGDRAIGDARGRSGTAVFAHGQTDALRTIDQVLPPALRAASRRLRTRCRSGPLDRHLHQVSLRRYSAGGFEPAPPQAPARRLEPGSRVVMNPDTRVYWSRDKGGCVWCAANGHIAATDLSATEIASLADLLNQGAVHGVETLVGLGSPASARRSRAVSAGRRGRLVAVLELLLSWRALRVMRAGRTAIASPYKPAR